MSTKPSMWCLPLYRPAASKVQDAWMLPLLVGCAQTARQRSASKHARLWFGCIGLQPLRLQGQQPAMAARPDLLVGRGKAHPTKTPQQCWVHPQRLL